MTTARSRKSRQHVGRAKDRHEEAPASRDSGQQSAGKGAIASISQLWQERDWPIAFAILAVLLILPWFNMNAPLHYDEAYTLDEYVTKPNADVTRDYSLPNNHIANSLLLRTWWEGLGRPNPVARSVWFLRVPMLLLWGVGLLCFFAFARMVVRPEPAFAAVLTAICAMLPHAVEYSFQLRGYGPSVAWFAMLLACTTATLRGGHLWLMVPAAVAMFMANYTVPTNLVVSGALWIGVVGYTWLGGHAMPEDKTVSQAQCSCRRLRIALSVVLAAAMLLSIAAYLPVMEQMKQHAHPYATLGEAVSAFPANLWQNVVNMMEGAGYTGLPWLTGALLIGGLIAAGVHSPRNHRARLLLWLAIPVLLLVPMLQSLLGRPAFVRNYCVLLPVFVAVLGWSAIGVGEVLNRLAARANEQVGLSWAVTGMLCCLLLLTTGVGGTHWARLASEHQPVEMLESLRPRLGNGSVLVYDRDADSYALFYYGRVLNMQQVAAFYEYVPKEAIGFIRNLFVAVGEKNNLGAILRYFGLERLEKTSAVREIGRFGKVTVYEVSGLQPGNS